MILDVAKLILDVFDVFGRRSMLLDVVRCIWTSLN